VSGGHRARRWIVSVLALAAVAPACSVQPGAAPRCGSLRRMALIAQSLPEASYLPCIDHLVEGWQDEGFTAGRGRMRFQLVPDRGGGRAVRVVLDETCPTSGAVPTRPRAEGVRTSIALGSIAPRYAGALVDEFPGGCVTYQFDFPRGPHIPLMEQLQEIVGLRARRDLRIEVRRELSVDLDP
jgi:hypothetical protein